MTQPGVDLAVLRLRSALPATATPAPIGGWGALGVGQGLVIAGFGLGQEGRPATARILRQARLVSTGAFASANSVLVAVDGKGLGLQAGAGACRGDSGGPILSEGGGALIGLVSWSSAPSASTGRRVCGGYTALTPLFAHRSWIAETAAALAQ
jgi:S1-C subfamily serine protease